MHEGPTTQSIIDIAIAALEEQGVTGRVVSVHVTVGVTQGMVPDAMQMFFEMQTPGTPLEGATLEIKLQSIVGHCAACDVEHELEEAFMLCPTCDGPLKMIKGKELLLTSIEVDQ
jgi:hydrogenase nickel incorporation protein HypA/HybF